MTDKKLIEEARGRVPLHGAHSLIRRLANALEAVEKAHTPTDDEREVLERIKLAGHLAAQVMVFQGDNYPVKAIPYTSFLQILDGFRRSKVPEPSAEHAYRGNRSQDTCWVMVDGEMCRKPVEAHAEPQAEPSAAQDDDRSSQVVDELLIEIDGLADSIDEHVETGDIHESLAELAQRIRDGWFYDEPDAAGGVR